MTGDEIVELAEELIDDSFSDTNKFRILNIAKNRLEKERKWEFLKAEDSSLTWTSGDTFETAKALPSDFRAVVNGGKLYLGEDRAPYIQIPFEMKRRLKDASRRWYIDVANSNFFIMGSTGDSKTIYLPYVKKSPDISALTSPTFDSDFHPIISFYMAFIFQGTIDSDDQARRMTPAQIALYGEIRDTMVEWDDDLKSAARENSRVPIDLETYPEVAF